MKRVLFSLLSFLVCFNVQAQEVQAPAQETQVQIQAPGQEATTTTTTTTQLPEGGTVTKVVETRNTIVTPVPAPKEVIATPQGYVACYDIAAGWFNDTWVPLHRVCQYSNTTQGVVWIDSYWGCNKATTSGVCTNWEWRPGHWQKTLAIY